MAPRITYADVVASNDRLTAAMESVARALVAQQAPVTSAPVAQPVAAGTVVVERTWATKAERAKGAGFACSCGRRDLRTAPHKGSFHKAPDGTTHTV